MNIQANDHINSKSTNRIYDQPLKAQGISDNSNNIIINHADFEFKMKILKFRLRKTENQKNLNFVSKSNNRIGTFQLNKNIEK